VADEKKLLRRILRDSRTALTLARVEAMSSLIQPRVLALDHYRNARTVVLYAPKDNEVQTESILAESLASGRAVYYLRLEAAHGRMLLVRVADAGELQPGAYGIREPIGRDTLDVNALGDAIICVPGLGFSRDGYRLGRGGGHYDRLIADIGPAVTTIGLAYSFQLLERMPQRPHDQRLDLVVTEAAVHDAACDSASKWGQVHEGGVPRCNC
jgi:5-formyltetrahydrofolate cyclo-ligase